MKRKKIALAIAAAFVGMSQAYAGSIAFTEVPVPTTDAQQRQVVASPSAVVDGRTVNIGFHTILRSGDKKKGVYGQIFDVDGSPLLAADGSPVISSDNDFASLLQGRHGNLFMVSHFESRPAAMYLTELDQKRNGELVAKRTRALDFSHVKGGWVHCAGSVTPWGTHLGSEEYEPDAKQWRDGNISAYNAAMATYFKADPADAMSAVNPYDYGYPVEVKVDGFDDAQVVKRYAMGRLALELAYVMPDGKTAYMSDDGTNVGLYRFVADEEGDLSAGTLWAAQWNQKSSDGMGAAKINWISLGSATDAQVKGWIDQYKFADIFDELAPAGGACASGYTSINAGHEGAIHQCLKLKDINGDSKINATDELIASRLETRRWIAMEGATTEFRKMEGITFNPDAGQLYLAMSEIGKGMENNTGSDVGGPNRIRVAKNNCGGVYALDVDGNYVATNMYGLIAGTPVSGDSKNTCDLNGLANPDNITYLPGYDTLIIGEDTGSGHQNDAIWSYNLDSRKLTRIETTPYGSETTSPYFYPNLNGHAYIMSVVQHPYGESDSDKLENPGQARAYTGYIGPFPAMDGEKKHGHHHWRHHR
jgi:secreted PhoX family phosphatase